MSCQINRQPPSAINYANFLIAPNLNNTCCSQGGSFAPVNLVSGELFNVPNFWTQTWNNYPDQQVGGSLLSNENWNSWNQDPIKKITDLVRTSKNAPQIAGTYFVEYSYCNKAQNPLANNANGYYAGDATGEPQNIYTVTQDNGGIGRNGNEFTVGGFKVGGDLIDSMYYFKFKAYIARFYFMANSTNPADIVPRYCLV